MRIRKAVVGDAKAIALVHIVSWQETYYGLIDTEYLKKMDPVDRAARWEKKLKKGEDIVLVLENDDGNIVGLASGGRHRSAVKSAEGELFTLYLLKEYQRTGWGKALFQQIRSELRLKGLKSLTAWVLEGNSASRFYEKMGGVKVSKKMLEIGDKDYQEVEYFWNKL